MSATYLRVSIFAAALAVTPVHSATSEQTACASGCLDPVAAVVLANRTAPRAPEPVKVVMTVQGVDKGERGPQREIVYYLNSEDDYRSQISVNLHVTEKVAKLLAKGNDIGDVRRAFFGKRIVVEGAPTRVKIYIYSERGRTNLFYYQTHIEIETPEQITFVEGDASQTSSTSRP